MTSAIPFAILVDYPAMIAEAAVRLLDGKARRIALIGVDFKGLALEEIFRQVAGGNRANGVATEVIDSWPGLESGAEVARALLQRPAAQRPEALIFADDFAAAGAAQTLAAQPDYRPGLASMANKQLPQSWALPVIRFEVDLDEVAERVVGMLAEAMLNPDLPPRQEKVRAKLAVGSEQ
jgi:DNA-binding LacI/PurR family transcriptional regulator